MNSPKPVTKKEALGLIYGFYDWDDDSSLVIPHPGGGGWVVEMDDGQYSLELPDASYRDAMIVAHAKRALGTIIESHNHQVIRTPEQLEELAQKDPNAVVLAGYVGVPRPAGTLYEMKEYGHNWIFPAVVIATGTQVREARETLEITNE